MAEEIFRIDKKIGSTMPDNDTVIRLARELVSRDSQSPPGGEGDVAQFIFDYLKGIGLKPEKQYFDQRNNRFNVLVFGSDDANLMINGHMDTVPINDQKNWKHNPFGEIANGKLYGRGACDTKGNIACLLAAMKENFNEKIVYVFNCEEELTLNGIKKVLELRKTKLRNVKYSISLEPTDGKIMMGNKGQYIFEVTAHGKTTHASQPHLGDNAIYKIARAALRIEEYNKKINKIKHPLFGHATASTGVIEGGTAPNVVPDLAKIAVDRRVLPNESPAKVEKELRELVKPLEFAFRNRVEACETPLNSRIVKEMQGILKDFKMDNKSYGFTATTELSEIRKHGIEGAIFGMSKLNQAHQSDEHVTFEELKTGTRILSSLLKKWD